jgi:RNA polymerase sigma-70 factor (ECF subfamily)
MSVISGDAAQWLSAARAGDAQALGQVLQNCWDYLLLIAREELDPKLRAKTGASDLVQDTFLEAQRDFAQFHGDTEDELLAWLRRLLRNNMANCWRHYRAKKRPDLHEVPLSNGSSSLPPGTQPAAATESPSHEAIHNEQLAALHRALARLPEDYQRVLHLRYEKELPFEEIGQLMGRTANAAQKLWARAVECLQQEMEGRT